MGEMFYIIYVFSIILFAILIYLLTKLIIERNTNSISMVKILGYKNNEIGKLYLTSTTYVVIISIIISMVLSTWLIGELYFEIMKDYTGWRLCILHQRFMWKCLLWGLLYMLWWHCYSLGK